MTDPEYTDEQLAEIANPDTPFDGDPDAPEHLAWLSAPPAGIPDDDSE